ncbi:hypothetical protein Q5752_004325 [Cryptotrichosporon argae]
MQTIRDLKTRMERAEKLIERLVQATFGEAGGELSVLGAELEQHGASSNDHETPDALSVVREAFSDANSNTGDGDASLSLAGSLGERNDYDQFQRVEEEAGGLVQFGPTSLWTCRSPNASTGAALPPVPAFAPLPGDWVDWSRNLPATLDITRATHDAALDYFAAYYAPWGVTVDVPAFLADLDTCNLARPADPTWAGPCRTTHYSPLLHNSALFLGLHMIRDQRPGLMAKLQSVFLQHCTVLLLAECDQTALSSLRAYNLFANCMHFLRSSTQDPPGGKGRQFATGFLLSGIAIAGLHSLGLNINSEAFVSRGRITERERRLRDDAFWNVYMQDTLRAVAAGRQPMLPEQAAISLPLIDPAADAVPWRAPAGEGQLCTGQPSMRSTCFHWTARFAVECRAVLETIYSPRARGRRHEAAVDKITARLKTWFRGLPLQPAAAMPLPHILMLHMYYHELLIFVHRPFYRSSLRASAGYCDEAAVAIFELLQLYQRFHDVRYAHHNLLNPIFAAATVFLLHSVGAPGDTDSLQRFEQCLDFMSQHALTWTEAAAAKDILAALKTEYMPHLADEAAAFPPGEPGAGTHFDDLQDWLSAENFGGLAIPDQPFLWDPSSLVTF